MLKATHTLLAAKSGEEADSVFRFIYQFDVAVEHLDEASATYGTYMARVMQAAGRQTALDKSIALLCEFRNMFLGVLIEIGWNIIIQSTGVPGLKCHLGTLKANPHVTPALPQFAIELTAAGHPNPVRLHKGGVPHPELIAFLNGVSGFRGA
jgi:hypothetical protein